MKKKLASQFTGTRPPLSEAERLFKRLGIDYTKNKDGTLKVNGDLDLSHKHLTRLPDLSNVEVAGTFSCAHNNLTSLKGAPQKTGRFDCSHNHLDNLVGAPKLVVGDFNCSFNWLTTLGGGPTTVFGSFYCNSNRLTSLEDGPGTVTRDYHCQGNHLATLKGAPETTGGDFWCQKNNLSSLKYAPKEAGKKFFCYENPITSHEFAPEAFGEFLSADGAWNTEISPRARKKDPALTPGTAAIVSPPPAPTPKESKPEEDDTVQKKIAASKFTDLLAAHQIKNVDTALVKIRDVTEDTKGVLTLKLENDHTLQLGKLTSGADFISEGPPAPEKKPMDRSDAAAIISLGKSHGWTVVTLHGSDHDKALLCIEAKAQGLDVKNAPSEDVLKKVQAEYDAAAQKPATAQKTTRPRKGPGGTP